MYHWNDDLCIGNSEIDDQHKKLFKIAARVEELIDECNSNPFGKKDTARQQRVLRETIKYLKSYVIEHFSAEEAFQLRIGYKEYKNHKKIHDNFAAEVERMEKKVYEDGCSDECVRNFLNWFSEWLYNHIMQVDQKIIEKEKEE